MNVYFEKNDSLLAVRPGDRIFFYAGLDVPVNAGNPDEFDYAGYLRSSDLLPGLRTRGEMEMVHFGQKTA